MLTVPANVSFGSSSIGSSPYRTVEEAHDGTNSYEYVRIMANISFQIQGSLTATHHRAHFDWKRHRQYPVSGTACASIIQEAYSCQKWKAHAVHRTESLQREACCRRIGFGLNLLRSLRKGANRIIDARTRSPSTTLESPPGPSPQNHATDAGPTGAVESAQCFCAPASGVAQCHGRHQIQTAQYRERHVWYDKRDPCVVRL